MSRLAAAAIGGVFGFVGGAIAGAYTTGTSTVYLADLNLDWKTDLFLESRNGERTIFIQQNDGTFKPLGDLPEDYRKPIQERADSIAETSG